MMNQPPSNTVDPDRLLSRGVITGDPASLKLFGCACCRRIWEILPDVSRRAVEVRERYEKGEATQAGCTTAMKLACSTRDELRAPVRFAQNVDDRAPNFAPLWAAGAASNACRGNWAAAAKLAAYAAACTSDDYEAGYRQERQAQCELFLTSGASQTA